MAETRNVYRATLNYDKSINQDKITVVFNGTTYADVPKQEDSTGIYYGDGNIRHGGDSIDDYAFCISSENGTNYVYVNEDVYNNHNPFTIKIIADSVAATECFKKVVRSIASPLVVKASCEPGEGTDSVPSVLDASPSEIQNALKTRGVVVEDPYGNLYSVLFATDRAVTIISSEYDAYTTPPTVLQSYMYTYENVLRYPKEGAV